ncbi:hypothetical protein [Kaistia sp. MMO-174]|uniref:hypothetical protein n=1 Tax=Kaistia sp. MMO-174 TaxID=3081256 RepID=UPI00301A81A2
MLRCAACGSEEIRGRDDDVHTVDQDDLSLAVHSLTKCMGDESRRLPDVVHYLTRAIPDLYPLAALLERETGRKLTP